jgi:hypothetical protein
LTLAVTAVLLTPGTGSLARAQGVQGDWCEDQRWNSGRQGVCEVRQYTLAATGGTLAVRGTNGGIQVEGAPRGDVHVLARVVATAGSEARAREIAKAVTVTATLDRVEADGPRELPDGQWWSVSYRLAVPTAINLSLQTVNGGISVRGVESTIEFRTTNGGVKLAAVGGDVRGSTTNGGVDVELEGSAWSGGGLDVETRNGGVRLAIPEQYSARLEASTQNGGLRVDIPGVSRDRRDRTVSADLGSGGAPIRVRTTNGGVRIARK